MTMLRAVWIFAVVTLCVGLIGVWRFGTHGTPDVLSMSPDGAHAYWSERIQSAGGVAAYKEFKRVYSKAPFTMQHPAAHVFGALLYRHEGLSGFLVCDSDFSFGCYHGYFGSAVAGSGVDVIGELDKKCIDLYGPYGTGCQHGIGHGVMEYMGDDIDGALALCARTTQLEPLFGCTSGVFMEYNTPINFSLTDTVQKPRSFDPEHPFEPCVSVVRKYRTSCYFEIGLWWKQMLGGDFAQVGALCGRIEDEDEREACYLGVGGVAAPTADFDIPSLAALCEKMPTREGALLCSAGASWTFWAIPERREKSRDVCTALHDESAAELCLKRANLIDA